MQNPDFARVGQIKQIPGWPLVLILHFAGQPRSPQLLSLQVFNSPPSQLLPATRNFRRQPHQQSPASFSLLPSPSVQMSDGPPTISLNVPSSSLGDGMCCQSPLSAFEPTVLTLSSRRPVFIDANNTHIAGLSSPEEAQD
mgnify:CR=1 FL=1